MARKKIKTNCLCMAAIENHSCFYAYSFYPPHHTSASGSAINIHIRVVRFPGKSRAEILMQRNLPNHRHTNGYA